MSRRVRHRAKLVGLRSGLKNQVHAVLAGAGVQVAMSDLFGPGGQRLLAATRLAVESRSRVDSLLRVTTALDFEIDTFARLVTGRLRVDPGYLAIQVIPGVGPLLEWCSSPRSATSPASPAPNSWRRGPG